MRTPDKIDRYLSRLCDDRVDSERSSYYRMGGKTIRVSDHIGNTSDGTYHIIVKPNGYLIHHPQTGTVNIVSYGQVKEFVRVFRLFPFADVTGEKQAMGNDRILGVHVSKFTPGQLSVIRKTAEKGGEGQPGTIGEKTFK